MYCKVLHGIYLTVMMVLIALSCFCSRPAFAAQIPADTSSTLPQHLSVLTENLPPYSMDTDKPTGFATENVRTFMDRTGISYTIRVMPWPRAFSMVKSHPDTLIYPMARTSSREDAFHWIGPVERYAVYVYSLMFREPVSSLEVLKQYQIGTTRNDAREEFLMAHGFMEGVNLHRTNSNNINVRKLFSGRVDYLLMPEITMKAICQELRLEYSKLAKVMKVTGISDGYLYIAIRRQADSALVEYLRAAYRKAFPNGLPHSSE